MVGFQWRKRRIVQSETIGRELHPRWESPEYLWRWSAEHPHQLLDRRWMCRCRTPQRITNSSPVRKKSPTSACRPSTSSTRRTTQRSRLAYRRPTTGVVGAVDVHVAAGAGGEAVVAAGAAAVVACPGDAAACARRDCNASIDSSNRRIDPHRSGPARSGVSNGPSSSCPVET